MRAGPSGGSVRLWGCRRWITAPRYKLRKTEVIKKIVLFPYAGRLRVYEIAFR